MLLLRRRRGKKSGHVKTAGRVHDSIPRISRRTIDVTTWREEKKRKRPVRWKGQALNNPKEATSSIRFKREREQCVIKSREAFNFSADSIIPNKSNNYTRRACRFSLGATFSLALSRTLRAAQSASSKVGGRLFPSSGRDFSRRERRRECGTSCPAHRSRQPPPGAAASRPKEGELLICKLDPLSLSLSLSALPAKTSSARLCPYHPATGAEREERA